LLDLHPSDLVDGVGKHVGVFVREFLKLGKVKKLPLSKLNSGLTFFCPKHGIFENLPDALPMRFAEIRHLADRDACDGD